MKTITIFLLPYKKYTLFVFMVHIDNLHRTVAGHGNTLHSLNYNQYRVWICKRYE